MIGKAMSKYFPQNQQVTYVTTKDGEELLLIWMPQKGFVGLTHNCKCIDILAKMHSKDKVRAFIEVLENDYTLQMIEDKKEVFKLIRSLSRD